MSGPGDGTFGYGRVMTRAEFAAMLPRLFGWSLVSPEVPAFQDNADRAAWYYDDIETAAANGAVAADGALFRPGDPITREEMAVMLVRGLGYATLADTLRNVKTPFTDVKSSAAYIAMAYDFGIITGATPTAFNPSGSATREQAAAMMVRLSAGLRSKLDWTHAFYAISAYGQRDLLPAFNAVSFGWSRLEIDGVGAPFLNVTASNGNPYSIPDGSQEVVRLAQSSGVRDNLSVFMSAARKITLSDGTTSDPCTAILTNPENRAKAVAAIVDQLQREGAYSGVTVDFEEMRGAALKDGLSLFLRELRTRTDALGLSVYVCVPPVTSDGIYYDGYDYRTIGECADKVILMAHDYAATSLTQAEMNAGFTTTPVSPIYEIYTALAAITNSETGVADRSKLALAVSFNSVQWKLQDNKVSRAAAYLPEPPALYSRMLDPAAALNYSLKYQNPYITYHNISDNTDNIAWYEDTRSVDAKMDLARMFGITGISFWRLGIIPAYGDTADRPVYYDIPAWLAGQK